MGFFDFLKPTFDKESLLNICKNDRRILHDNMLAQAKAVSRNTVRFDNSEQFGTCRVEDVANGIYRVTINGNVWGLDDFGSFTSRFNYTKTIYIDQYGDLNTTVGTSSVVVKKA